MEELFPIKYGDEEIKVSVRELHNALEIKERFSAWFKRIEKYFGNDEFTSVGKPTVVNNGAELMLEDYETSVENAKHICLMCKTDKGRQCRQYLIDLEKAWNTPEQVMARALKVADRTIEKLTSENKALAVDNERMKPKEIFADAVSTSHTSILVGDLAKILKQNGFDIGATRLFERLRTEGYLIRRKGSDWNMPTQKSMEMGLFEIKETTSVNPDGSTRTNKTPKVTGKGQIYFVNRYIGKEKKGKPQCEEK